MHKWYRSLRWRLQFWHTLILVLVIATFGFTLHMEAARSLWDIVDEELLSTARVLEGGLRLVPEQVLEAMAKDLWYPPGPRIPPPRVFEDHPPPPPEIEEWKKRLNQEKANSAVNPRWIEGVGLYKSDEESKRIDVSLIPGKEPIPASEEEWLKKIHLPDNLPTPLGRKDIALHYVIWKGDGTIIKQFNAPESLSRPPEDIALRLRDHRYLAIDRGIMREIFVPGPHFSLIQVGRVVIGEQRRLHNQRIAIGLIGAIILGIGMAGGWWLSGRAIKPITKMSQTASLISASNLTARMDLDDCDSELANLGNVLNSMLERLDLSFRQQQQFTSDASHELRTPLASILANSELALHRERTADEYEKFLKTNLTAARRMQRMVETLLALARLDHNDASLEKSSFSPIQLIHRCLDSVTPLSEQRQVHVNIRCSCEHMVANESSIEQAVENLVRNAIQYNRTNGSVWVEFDETPAEYRITIRDNGIGMSKEECDHAFDRFYRADPVRNSTSGGCGLGLSIVRKIIELHSGTIQLSSIPSEGTTALISIPKMVQS